MAYTQVTCACCKKKLNKNEAFAVQHGKRFSYYCSKYCYETEQMMLRTFEVASHILSCTQTTHLKDGLQKIAYVVGWRKLLDYLVSERDNIDSILSRVNFYNNKAKITYFLRVVENQINDFGTEKLLKFQPDICKPYRGRNRKPNIGMEDLLNNILGGQL